MPELVKMYIRNVVIGFGIAAVFVAMLLWFNVMNLWGLVASSDAGLLAVFLLWFMHGIVFAGRAVCLGGDGDGRKGYRPSRRHSSCSSVPAGADPCTRLFTA